MAFTLWRTRQEAIYLVLCWCDRINSMPYVLNLHPYPSKGAGNKNRFTNKQQLDASIPKTAAPKDSVPSPSAQTNLPQTISWQALEYAYIKKTPDWYWAVGILTIGLFIVALIFSNFLFSIFVLLSGFTIALYGARAPQVVSFCLSIEGVRIRDRVYPYDVLKSFWIFYHPPQVKELSIESQKLIMPQIKIPLGEANPAQVRAYLQQFLPERQQEESFIDVSTRYLGF